MATTSGEALSILAHRLADRLTDVPHRIVACSGGVDSLLLADLAHAAAPAATIIAHSVTPAVPESATARVREAASDLGWRLEVITSPEFADDRYLANPVDRCYFCKSNLYAEIERISAELGDGSAQPERWTILSGANTDDLGEYRPGLTAAGEHAVRHPYVEAGLGKTHIRALAAQRGRGWHDLPAAPCLASRLYTGTRVTPSLVRAVDRGEELLRHRLGLGVVRARVAQTQVRVEVTAAERDLLDEDTLSEVLQTMREAAPQLESIVLDPDDYRPGRSFVSIVAHEPERSFASPPEERDTGAGTPDQGACVPSDPH